MKSQTTRRFWQLYKALPKDVREQANAAYELWRNDPRHNSLHFKKVENSIPLDSVRAGLGYRAVGKREGHTIKWFWDGGHVEFERLLRSS